ncbi:MAG: response regulator [Nitrospinae bacterium]|nr:response regulator [Nitrospinota bacterium]
MLKNKTVLVAEDNVTVRRFISSVLKNQLNCPSIVQVSSANEAIDIIKAKSRRSPISLILSDWEMPGMTGDEFLLTIREDQDTADIPFIMVTARNDRDSIIMAAQAGVSEYLVKPFSAAVLIQKITRVMGLLERRAMNRFKSLSEDKVELIFNEQTRYNASLVNVSQTGLLAKTPLFHHGSVSIYDELELDIHASGVQIKARGEIVRMEADRDNPNDRNVMLIAFQFCELEEGEAKKLKTIISGLLNIDTPAAAVSPLLAKEEKPAEPPKKKRLDMDL